MENQSIETLFWHDTTKSAFELHWAKLAVSVVPLVTAVIKKTNKLRNKKKIKILLMFQKCLSNSLILCTSE